MDVKIKYFFDFRNWLIGFKWSIIKLNNTIMKTHKIENISITNICISILCFNIFIRIKKDLSQISSRR